MVRICVHRAQHFTKQFKSLYGEFCPRNFMFFNTIVKIVLPSTTMSLDIGKHLHTFKGVR